MVREIQWKGKGGKTEEMKRKDERDDCGRAEQPVVSGFQGPVRTFLKFIQEAGFSRSS